MFDEYELKARYIPSILASVPLMMLSSVFEPEVFISLFRTADFFLVVKDIGLSLVVIFLVIHFQRFIGKYLIEAYLFDAETKFPTTEMLLWSDSTLSRASKNKLHKQVKEDFDIDLLNADLEKNDTVEAIKLAIEVVALIRRRVGKGVLTYQHNIQYGFMRNLIAGSILSLPSSLVAIYVFIVVKPNFIGAVIASIYSVLFVLLVVFHRQILKWLANNYAKVLFAEYLTLGGVKR